MTTPQATAEQINIVLRRAAPITDSAEARLIVAILNVAVADAMNASNTRSTQFLAQQFSREGTYRVYCELVELDPDWVGKVLRDYAGIECGREWGRGA